MKAILFVTMALAFTSAASANCLSDIKSSALASTGVAQDGNDYQIGATSEIYADGQLQTTRIYIDEKAVDGEANGVGYVLDVTVQPTDKNLSVHAVSQSCEIVSQKAVN